MRANTLKTGAEEQLTHHRCRLKIVMQRRICCLCEHAELLLCSLSHRSSNTEIKQETVLWSASHQTRQRPSGFLGYHVFILKLDVFLIIKFYIFSVFYCKYGFASYFYPQSDTVFTLNVCKG